MDSDNALGLLPVTLRKELLQSFHNIVTNFRERKWEPSELNGGKFCEVVYTILKGYTDGNYPLYSSKPKSMVNACQNLSNVPSSFPRSVRFQIPRILIALYEVRNHRGVAHIGGEVNSNHMDAAMVLYVSKWVMAELVRLFHSVDITTATTTVEALTEREVPIIWQVNGKKRVLKNEFTLKEKALILLYSETKSVSESDLVVWAECDNASVFRRDVLLPGHKARLWEYDKSSKKISISPLGNEYVERRLM